MEKLNFQKLLIGLFKKKISKIIKKTPLERLRGLRPLRTPQAGRRGAEAFFSSGKEHSLNYIRTSVRLLSARMICRQLMYAFKLSLIYHALSLCFEVTLAYVLGPDGGPQVLRPRCKSLKYWSPSGARAPRRGDQIKFVLPCHNCKVPLQSRSSITRSFKQSGIFTEVTG